MVRWFGGQTRSDGPIGEVGLPAGVPASWAKELSGAFARLAREDPGLAGSLVSFVLSGTPEDAPGRVVAHVQQVKQTRYDTVDVEPEPLLAVAAGLGTVPVPVAVRAVAAVSLLEGWWRNSDELVTVEWLDGFLLHLIHAEGRVPGRRAADVAAARAQRAPLPLHAEVVEAMLAATGNDPSLVVAAAFKAADHYYGHHDVRDAAIRLTGYDGAVRRHTAELRPLLRSGTASVDDRLAGLEALALTTDETAAGFAEEIAACLTTTSTKVEKAARPFLDRLATALDLPLRALATGGNPGERSKALSVLHDRGDETVRAWCESTAAGDRAASVRSLVDQWSRRDEVATSPQRGSVPEPVLAEIPVVDWRTEVTPELRRLLHDAVQQANEDLATSGQRYRYADGDQRPIDPAVVDALLDDLTAGRKPTTSVRALRHSFHSHQRHRLWTELRMRRQALQSEPLLLLALLDLCGELVGDYHPALDHDAITMLNELSDGQRPTPLLLAAAIDDLGHAGARVVFNAWGHSWSPYGQALPDEDWAPFVLAHLDLVIAELQSSSRDYWLDDDLGYRAARVLPTLPAPLVEVLVELALGSRKKEHRPAQEVLAAVPGIEERAIAALADAKAEKRAVAAAWLARLKVPSALSALEEAVRKEGNDLAHGALLDALEALGQPVERYLDRDDLLAKAAKLVAKPLPAALAWFPWAGLPAVHWADSGKLVDDAILRWLLVQATKARSPEPNAVLRRYCAMFEPRDRAAFGQYVLEAWIAEDLRPIDLAEARERAASEAHWAVQYPGPVHGMTVEQATAILLPRVARTPAGSAIAAKGVLAVVAACAGQPAVPVTERYLRDWYGQRAAQGRALIQMLAWIDDPSATQLVLAVGSRFRTKSFQEEATRQAAALAERKGWTMSELADRTVPTAGLDDAGVLELSYGERAFTARLLPDLTLDLVGPEGKPVKTLPAPRQTDDETLAKEARKTLAATKKELKSVAAGQTERLYEALCTGRTWTTDVWSTYLHGHPVLGRLVSRLAWMATAPDGTLTVFRPLDDGTLTDVDDEPVLLGPDDTVAIAHDTAVAPEVAAAWLEHFADYEVAPLFVQFGKERYVLPEDRRTETEIVDFRGHLVEAFKLRGRANKLGYTRGAAEDGGVFMTYEKRFPALGVTTVVEFTGNSLPEENRVVALLSLHFERITPQGRGMTVPLGDLPAVLLSEAYGDLTSLAAQGGGFDPDWEKKSQW
ncbi:DUF4132 domain-containing protein [Nocardioides aromaticivorans]|uniref:DUF4132 domain-containing protein n=1 Tax=Nocardioides aromaticivorans TaxID=200618 RepID=UPI001A8D2DBD|nr:DUF4132 domain-containing protein [Nocardioides aromaticivorans]